MGRKTFKIGIVMLVCFIMSTLLVYGYGEGPSDSGRWVYGHVSYSDGSKCGKCGHIRIETENGFSEKGFTNSDGDYKIYVFSNYVKALYFRGDKVWKGSKKTKGGVRINILLD